MNGPFSTLPEEQQQGTNPDSNGTAQQLLQMFRSRRQTGAVPVVLNNGRPPSTPTVSNSPDLLIAPVVLDPCFSSRSPIICLADSLGVLFPAAQFEAELVRRPSNTWGEGVAKYVEISGDNRERILAIDRFQDIMTGEVGSIEKAAFLAALSSLSEVENLNIVCFTSLETLSNSCVSLTQAGASPTPILDEEPNAEEVRKPAAAESKPAEPAITGPQQRRFGIMAVALSLPTLAFAVGVVALLFGNGYLDALIPTSTDSQEIDINVLLPSEATYIGQNEDPNSVAAAVEPPQELTPVSSQAAQNPPAAPVLPEPEPVAVEIKAEPVPVEALPESRPKPEPEPETAAIQQTPAEQPEVAPTQDAPPEPQPEPTLTPVEPEPNPLAFLADLSEPVAADKIANLTEKWNSPQAKTLAQNWQSQLGVESAVIGTEIGNRYKNSDEPDAFGKAAWWYAAASKAGDITGTYEWGRCQLFGDGIETDPEAAFKALYKAYEGGNPDAAYLLGICESYGIGVEEARPTHGRFYLQYARDYGVAEAWYELGKLNVEGAFDPEPKLAWACRLFREGAKAGHRESMIRAAEFYEAGEVITRNLKEANALRKAADEAGGSEMFDRVRKLIEEKGTEPEQGD